MDVSVEAAKRLKIKRRVPEQPAIILGFAAAIFGVAGDEVGTGAGPSWSAVARLLVIVVVGFLVGWQGLRSTRLAWAAALAPLPGAVAAFSVRVPSPGIGACLEALTYALGFAVALTVSDRAILSALSDEHAPSRRWRLAAAFLVVTLAPLALQAALLPVGAVVELGLADLLAIVFGVLAPHVVLPTIKLEEDFIASFNRSREAWARLMERLAEGCEPPMSASAVGIFAVFMAMALFGIHGYRPFDTVHIFAGVGSACLTTIIGAYLLTRDVRRSTALGLSVCGAVVFSVWVFARANGALTSAAGLLFAQLLALGFAIAGMVAERASGDDFALATRSAVSSAGPAIGLTALIAVAALALFDQDIASLLAALSAVLFSIFSALIVQGALVRVLEMTLPRPRTLAERYRVK